MVLFCLVLSCFCFVLFLLLLFFFYVKRLICLFKDALEAERKKLLAAKSQRKAAVAKGRGEVVDGNPKAKKEAEKRLRSRVAIPFPDQVPTFPELLKLVSSSAPAKSVAEKKSAAKQVVNQVEVAKSKSAAAKKEAVPPKKDVEVVKPKKEDVKVAPPRSVAAKQEAESVANALKAEGPKAKKEGHDLAVEVAKKEPEKMVVAKEPENVVEGEHAEAATTALAVSVDDDSSKKSRKKKKKKGGAKNVADSIPAAAVSTAAVASTAATASSSSSSSLSSTTSSSSVVSVAQAPRVMRTISVEVSMELFEESSVVVPKKNVFDGPPRSIETAIIVTKLFSACSFSAFVLVAGSNVPASKWMEGDIVELTVPEREVADAPLRQGEPLSGIVIWTAPDKPAEMSVICNRIGLGPLGTSVSRSTITLACKGDDYVNLLPNWVSASLNWFAGLKYECLLVDTEHQEFCRDCAGAVLDFIKPPKDMDGAALVRLRSWLPRLSVLVSKAPIPQRVAHAREMARLCFAASVATPGSQLEIERLTLIRDKVLFHLRHDEWPSTVELHFNPISASAAMDDDFAVTTYDQAKLIELQFNELVDRSLDELLPQKCFVRSSAAGKLITGPLPLLIHFLPAAEKDPILLWVAHDWTVAVLMAEACTRFDVPLSEVAVLSLVLRRPGEVVQTLCSWTPLSTLGLIPGDHLWMEDTWDTPLRLTPGVDAVPSPLPETEYGIRHIASWTDGKEDFMSFTFFIRITKQAARFPLVVTRASELPEPLSTVSEQDRLLLQQRLVRIDRCTDPMEKYLCHLNYWMDVRSPSGALQRGMLAQPVAYTLCMDDPQTLMQMSQHDVRERIVYGEWDVDSEESSSAGEETEDSEDTDEVTEQWEASALCEGCKFDNGRKPWARCEQCGLVNTRSRNKGGHLAAVPDLNTVVYWNREWHLASAKQYESRKRILSLGPGEIWMDRLRSLVQTGKVGEVAVTEGHRDQEKNGEEEMSANLVFCVRASDSDPKQTQVSLRPDQHAELEPLEVELELVLTTATGTPVSLNDLWTETPESEPRHPYIWIFGDPGTGKSWLSRHMCRLFNDTGVLSAWRERFDAVTRVFLPDLLRSCSQYGDLITSKELLDAAWSLCNPTELGLNTVRVGSAYERRTDRVLWILDGYDEAERMLDLENRRPGTNFRFMQGLAASSLYYLQNAIIFSRAAPELEMVSGTRLMLRGIALQNPSLSLRLERLRELQSIRVGVPENEQNKLASMISWEDWKAAFDILLDLQKMNDRVAEEIEAVVANLASALSSLVIVDQHSKAKMEKLMIECRAKLEDPSSKNTASETTDERMMIYLQVFVLKNLIVFFAFFFFLFCPCC